MTRAVGQLLVDFVGEDPQVVCACELGEKNTVRRRPAAGPSPTVPIGRDDRCAENRPLRGPQSDATSRGRYKGAGDRARNNRRGRSRRLVDGLVLVGRLELGVGALRAISRAGPAREPPAGQGPPALLLDDGVDVVWSVVHVSTLAAT